MKETPKTHPGQRHNACQSREDEARFNNWIPRPPKKEIKAYRVQHDISQKDITITALKDFLRSKGIKIE